MNKKKVGERIYFMVLNSVFIILPSNTNFKFPMPKAAVEYIKCAELKKIILFFTDPFKHKALSKFGILCEIVKTAVDEKNTGVAELYLKSVNRIKIRKDSLEQVNGFIEEYETIKDSVEDCSKDNVEVCLSEIIDQINGIKSDKGRIIAAYILFSSQKKPDNRLKKEDTRLIIEMLANPELSEIYRETLNYFYGYPNKLSVWIDSLFNEIFIDKLVKAKWHVLNEQKIITRLELLVENFVPIFCEIIDQEYPASGMGQSLVPCGQKDNAETNEVQEIEEKIKNSKMPSKVIEAAQKELRRLKQMRPENSDYQVCFHYLDVMTSLPWGIFTKDNLDINNIQKVLDNDHYGLNDVKERIIEFLSVQKLNPDHKGTVLCFVGPPGTGKTSVAHSIGRAFGRKMIRISLGSMRDEAEIKGHRRTYIGANPGKIINEIIRAGSQNPVFIFDEIDKLREDAREDPASALLDIFDPEQNQFFVDNYLDVEFDLSRTFFITTANMTDTIPPALLDRMDVIEFPSYTEEEKLEIVKRHLAPKQIKEHGLNDYGVRFTDEAMLNIIRFYTREPGVRKLERRIKKIFRKINVSIAKDENVFKKGENVIECEHIRHYLGRQKFFDTDLFKEGVPGVATGLAWSQNGGNIIHIEARETWKLADKFKITGLPQEIMIQSVEDSVTYLNTNRHKLGIDDSHFHEDSGIHVRFRHGGIPKDGPSAGITIAVAIYSEFTKKPVRNDIAFTGEIMLSGTVDPIGGLKEKILAAKRVGVKKVFIPIKNSPDVEEFDNKIKRGLEIIFIEDLSDIFIKYRDDIFLPQVH